MLVARYAVAVLALGLFLFPSDTVKAQDASAPRPIQLDVDVTNAKGQQIAGLPEKYFTVLDNKTPRPISAFAEVNRATSPTEVLIVLDAVNTPYTALSYQREQIAKYLRNNGEPLPFPTTFAILSDTKLELYNDLTKNGAELADELEKKSIGLREISRAQGFWGANDRLGLSINGFKQLTMKEQKLPGRKLVLWVSPGWPILSGPDMLLNDKQQRGIFASVVAFSTQLREDGITLYSVNSWGADESVGRAFYYRSFEDGLKRPEDAVLGNLALQVLAEQSGGLVLNTSDVVSMLKQCVADADHYYRITFQPEPGDKPDAYHQLQVKLAEGKLMARTRQGYYTQP